MSLPAAARRAAATFRVSMKCEHGLRCGVALNAKEAKYAKLERQIADLILSHLLRVLRVFAVKILLSLPRADSIQEKHGVNSRVNSQGNPSPDKSFDLTHPLVRRADRAALLLSVPGCFLGC